MGNANCVPQAPRFRASFSRKSSLKGKKEDSIRRRGGLFGSESSQDGDTKATDKILYYIPGTDIPGPESHKENVDQPFLSVFKKGRQKMPVRNLGKIVHYAKVKFKFQHCPDISDCYLELFPSCLYFQAHGSSGLTYQGLLPLTLVSISRLEIEGEHAFQITGPLPSPLLVFCPSKSELRRWLYHLEKQMDLVRGPQCPSLQFQGPLGENHLCPLPWALQHYPVHHWEGTSRESLGDVVCASRVKMQHLPSQEQHDRILILYPSTLVILSEDSDGLNFKGELPLNAIQLNFEESEKQIRSFLIEGHLINTIRVLCASYEDYQDWLLCFRAIHLRRGGSSTRSGSESFQGPRPPLPTQFSVSGRASLTSDGRTNSWASTGAPSTSSHTSSSLPDRPVLPDSCPVGADSTPQRDHGQANPNISSLGRHRAELRRRSSSRSSKGKGTGQLKGEEPALRAPLHLDLGLTNLNRRSLEVLEGAAADTPEKPQSPLYADPYTPTSTTHNKITDVSDLDEFLVAAKSCVGQEPPSTFPTIPVSVPVPVPSPSLHPLQKKPAPQHRESQRHRGSFKVRGAGPLEPSRTRQVQVTPSKEGSPEPQLRLPGGSSPSRKGHEQGRSSSEPSSGQRDFSYDNIWDQPGPPSSSRHKWHRPPASEAAGRLTQWI
ncbi:pleckstrin homology domain-containing family N member 1 isoform X1 [Phascolarctos cinereus]|uniref:Pleckstrin homology domain-containing family N member 1 isoform X1 n=1 Tax=Phascolarctos cinereus TaxID=38626 RepID=A0A6P5JMR0_PHACI|nr:pleckstrin homology domain-containing family N member 1 isoform X1 [Phascolarctos cinereus]